MPDRWFHVSSKEKSWGFKVTAETKIIADAHPSESHIIGKHLWDKNFRKWLSENSVYVKEVLETKPDEETETET